MYGALVGLVQHDDGVLLQVGVDETLAEHHPVRHVLDLRLRTRAVLEPNRVPDLQTPSKGSGLFSDALNAFHLATHSKHFTYSYIGRKEMLYLTTHSTHFIYGYMASDIW